MDYLNPNTTPNPPPPPAPHSNTVPTPKNNQDELLGKKNKKGGGILGRILACVLGFILGIVGTVGGVVGAGYWAVSQPISTVATTISGLLGSDFDYTEFIDESYGDKQVMALISDTVSVVSSISDGSTTLDSLAKISPKVNELATYAKDTIAQVGIDVTEEELLTTPISGMVDFFMERLNKTPIGNVLKKFGMESSLLMAICYGEENVDYTIDENGNVTMIGDKTPLLVEDLLGDDVLAILGEIPLDSILKEQHPDGMPAIFMAICYGDEGVDYTVDADGNVTMLGDSKKTLLSDLLSGDINALFGKVPLDSILKEQHPDGLPAIFMALCYGEEGVNYTVDADGNVTMLGDSKKTMLSDLLGGELTSLFDNIPLDSILKEQHPDGMPAIFMALCYGEEGVDYTVDADGNVTMLGDSKKTMLSDLLAGNITDLFNNVPLDILLDGKDLDEVNPLLLALCYGEEGVDYTVDADGNVTMLGDSKKTMLKDLLEGDTTELLGKIPLDTLIKKDENGKLPPLHMTLCYGEEGVDYTVDADGNVTMLGDSKKTMLSDLLSGNITDIMYKVPLGALLTDLDPNDPGDDMMFALAYGTKDVTYKIVTDDSEAGYHVEMQQLHYYKTEYGFADYEHVAVDLITYSAISGKNAYRIVLDQGVDKENQPVTETQYVVYDATSNTYLAYKNYDEIAGTFSDPILFKKTLVGQLTSDAMPLLEHLYLKDLLNVRADSNKVLRNLAYGIEGIDYIIRNGEIVMVGDAMPHTIGYLKEHKDDLIDSIHLSDVIPANYNSGIIMYMLYGTKGLHYVIENEGTPAQSVKMLPAFIYVRNGIVYDEHGYEREANTYTLTHTAEGWKYTYHEHTYDLVQDTTPGKEDLYYLYLNGEQATFETTRLGDLSGAHNPLVDFQESLTLADVLGRDSLSGNAIFSALADCKISELPTKATELKVKDVFADYESNVILKSLGNEKLLDIPNKVTELKVKDVFADYESNALLKSLGECELLDIPNQVTSLKVKDVFADYASNALLKNLGECELLDIPNQVTELKVGQIFEDIDTNPILKNLTDCKLMDIPSRVTTLTVEQIFGDQINYVEVDGEKIPTGTWKYLLYNHEKDTDGNKTDKTDYDLNLPILTSFNSLMTNMTHNMHTSTLNELSADGIISGLESNLNNPIRINLTLTLPMLGTINKPIPGIQSIRDKVFAKNGTEDNVVDPSSGKEALTLGELSIQEMLSYLGAIFTMFDELANGNLS